MIAPAQRGRRNSLLIDWSPAGAVAAAFEASLKLNPVIIGPVGSGKTTAAVRKIAGLAHRVPPLTEDVRGVATLVKRCRVAVLATDYRILWKNLMPSYWKVFPKEWGSWIGGNGEPAVHKFKLDAGRDAFGRPVLLDIQVDFIGIGDKSLDEVTRGLELTGAYVYEFDTLPPETITKFASRLGRFPNMPTGALQDTVPRQIWCDANAFDVEHWAYLECFEDPPAGREVFVQPGARSPHAENIQFVGRAYYDQQMELLKPWQIERLIDNRFVPDRGGFLVYPDWNPAWHESPTPIEVRRSLPLMVGVDPGLNSGAIIYQRHGRNIWRALGEFGTAPDETATAEPFGRDLGDFIARRWPGLPALAIIDPSGANKNAAVATAWLKEFAKGFDYPMMPALSNRVKGEDGRLAAVARCLQHTKGGEMGYLVDPSCKYLRRGFNGAYRYKAKDGKRTDEIDKNHASHYQDAGQYPIQTIEAAPELMDRAGGGRSVMTRRGGAPPAMSIIFD